jgi:hypothetical protein
VKPRISWADRADLLAAWEVVEDRFGRRGPPSTLLGVAALGFPETSSWRSRQWRIYLRRIAVHEAEA